MRPFKRILVIRIGFIGDVLWSTPALRGLRKTFPDSEIDVLVTAGSKQVLFNNPDIDDIIVFAKGKSIRHQFKFANYLRKKRYDCVFILNSIFRTAVKGILLSIFAGIPNRISFDQGILNILLTKTVPDNKKQHEADSLLDVVGLAGVKVNSDDRELVFLVSPEDRRFIDKFLKDNNIKKEDGIIIVHPGTGISWPQKRWDIRQFAALADELYNNFKVKVIVTGGPDETDLVSQMVAMTKSKPLDASGKLTLTQLAALMTRAIMVITNDTGPLHLAVAVKTPTVSVFGPTDPRRNGPYGSPESNLVVRTGISCSPCRSFLQGEIECDRNYECIRELKVSQVMEAVEKLLAKSTGG